MKGQTIVRCPQFESWQNELHETKHALPFIDLENKLKALAELNSLNPYLTTWSKLGQNKMGLLGSYLGDILLHLRSCWGETGHRLIT